MTELINIKDLSDKVSIPVGELYKMCSRRQIPYVKLGGRIRFDVKEVEKYLKERTVAAKAVGQ